ncbi:MAG: hypothetical protein ACKVJE_05020 [Pseudomonadales bacterium]
MKLISTILALLILTGCETVSVPQSSSKLIRFFVSGGSYVDPRGVDYFVVIQNEEAPEELKKKLRGYASYILEYRGLSETLFPNDAGYIVLVSYKGYETSDNKQYYELAAASKKVYEATSEFRPSWGASSVHYDKPAEPGAMLAMHALAIRDVAGGNPTAYQLSVEYEVDSELVQSLIKKVEKVYYIGGE